MTRKVEAPIVGTEVDPSDPMGTVSSFAVGVAGVVLLIATVFGAEAVWNWIADRTPDEVGTVEVL